MKLITSAVELSREFSRLCTKYNEYHWVVAWAGIGSSQFGELKLNQNKIKKLVVGLHFYQTHPDFIECFLKNARARFIKQPQGTFHPKLYLFYNSSRDWEILMGSANFTKEAFTRNTEASTLITSSDDNGNGILRSALELIDSCWGEAGRFNAAELDMYRQAWKNHRPKINSLSGNYGGGGYRAPKPIYLVPACSMPWVEFFGKVKAETGHGLKRRLRVLKIAKSLFASVEHFSDLGLEERKFIAGMPNILNMQGAEYWGYFGSMKGAGIFKNRVIQNDLNISRALDQIPLSGKVTETHYSRFIEHYRKAFSGNYIATATRLLAMKRPDTFFCLTSQNQKEFCKDFGVTFSAIDYNGYWEQVVERIYDSNWWLNPSPRTSDEKLVSEARAAFLDSIYYEY